MFETVKKMQAAEITTKIMTIIYAISVVMANKNVGITPHRSASVDKPKDSPGLFGSLDAIVHKVTGMFILKRMIPIRYKADSFGPNNKNGIDRIREAVPTVFAPNASEKNPPNTFPVHAASAGKRINEKDTPTMLGKLIPTNDLIKIDIKQRIITIKKVRFAFEM